jgi:hypothetical protein
MGIKKTIIQVTVLHEDNVNLDNYSLSTIATGIDNGDWLGPGASVVVPAIIRYATPSDLNA